KSLVQTDEASPYWTPLAQRSASSSSVKRCTVMTGPKTSSWMKRSSCLRPDTTVGSKKYPRSPCCCPPALTSACDGTSEKNDDTRASWLALLTGGTSASSSPGPFSYVVAVPLAASVSADTKSS